MATSRRIQHVRPPAQAVMAKHRAQNQLNIQHEDREQSQGKQAGTALVEFDPRNFFHPILPGEQGDQDDHAEKRLRQRGVRGGDRRRQVEEHREPAQNSLRDDQAQRGRRRDISSSGDGSARQVQTARMMRQKSDKLGDHAVGMLELHAADQMRESCRANQTKSANRGRRGRHHCWSPALRQ